VVWSCDLVGTRVGTRMSSDRSGGEVGSLGSLSGQGREESWSAMGSCTNHGIHKLQTNRSWKRRMRRFEG
jgi:hypothetical protein